MRGGGAPYITGQPILFQIEEGEKVLWVVEVPYIRAPDIVPERGGREGAMGGSGGASLQELGPFEQRR
jgi:hypothetical protein